TTHLDENENIIKYDKIRSKELKKIGIKVLRFWNDDVLNGLETVCGIINDYLEEI
ncbi:hypothetical protein COZ73_01225, partial [Candidatus Falkowbacteria bacterium CG_4_8_14_3_um_filter_36_11]